MYLLNSIGNVSFAKVGAWATQALSGLQARIGSAAAKALSYATSRLPSNPLYSGALLLAAALACIVKISACFSRAKKAETLIIPVGFPRVRLETVPVDPSSGKILTSAKVLEDIFERSKGVELIDIKNCTEHLFDISEEGGCFKGVDSQDRLYYAFRLFYKDDQTGGTSTGIEVIYQDASKGIWQCGSKNPILFKNKGGGTILPMAAFVFLAQKEEDYVFKSKTSLMSCSFKPFPYKNEIV